MAQEPAMTEQTALDWIIRQRDPGFDDWDAFVLWLEADPAHADAYHAMAAADKGLDDLLTSLPTVQEMTAMPEPARLNRRAWIGGALAASIVAAVSLYLYVPRSDPWAVETAPGVRRTVTLADGSNIALNGGTRVMLDHANPRTASLERGEAMFTISHDPDHPFEVQAGETRLVDIGTAFNVLRDNGQIDIAVSEGAVLYNPGREAVRIDAGHRLHADDKTGTYMLDDIPSSTVAGWRQGQLVYDGQSLERVAADLSRYYGINIAVTPAIAGQGFRGVLSLPPKEKIETLAPILNVNMRQDAMGWILTPR